LHVVMLSDLETEGGAAVAASRLAEGLCSRGVRVTRVVHKPDQRVHNWQTVSCPDSLDRPINAWPVEGGGMVPDLGTPGDRSTIVWVERLMNQLNPDVVNIHNIHWGTWGKWANELVDLCSERAPTVWTLHDMWSFTGRCAYSYDCLKFKSGCDSSCPTPTEYPELSPDLISPAWIAREGMFRRNPRLVAVAPSQWLTEQALHGLWRGHRIERIPYDLPLDRYTMQPRSQAREVLGLPSSELVFLAIAQDLSERRKGGGILERMLKEDVLPHFTLLTVGEGAHSLVSDRVAVRSLGYVSDEAVLVSAYNAADAILHAAPVDNFPNVVLEAMACGTPTVAFPVGGMPELVRPGRTGWLATEVSPSSLAQATAIAVTELNAGLNLRYECRRVAQSEFVDGLQADRYIRLFTSMLNARGSAPA
jgi:glycosyltransferase involved in cell wall biosynthesis